MATNDDHFPTILQAGAGDYLEVVLGMLVPGSELQNDVGIDSCWEAGHIFHMAGNGFHSVSF